MRERPRLDGHGINISCGVRHEETEASIVFVVDVNADPNYQTAMEGMGRSGGGAMVRMELYITASSYSLGAVIAARLRRSGPRGQKVGLRRGRT